MFRQVLVTIAFCVCSEQCVLASDETLQVGIAAVDITPPVGFPIAGYFHERLADGQLDPLMAKAIVLRSEDQAAAIVVCDLIAASADFTNAVREQASQKTGIPANHIMVSATHSHTAPDYSKSMYSSLRTPESPSLTETQKLRHAYIEHLISGTVKALVTANELAEPVTLKSGWVEQQTPVAFNRRFVQRDGSVKTWVGLEHPESVRSAGPVDPEIGLVLFENQAGRPKGLLSNFALHLDTVGGTKWSADYPKYISDKVQKALGADVVSIFGPGCCGDINHVNPRGKERNKTDFIGNSLGDTIVNGFAQLTPVDTLNLQVRSSVVHLPLRESSAEEVARAVTTMKAASRGESVEFFDQVISHRQLLIDQLRNQPRHASDEDRWEARVMTAAWEGIGDSIPANVQVIAIGPDVAIVALPGEVFVELGLAIKRGSPFRTTLIVELSNCSETCYVPTRAAYAGGSYEVTNSTLQPGAGEMLVEEALRQLRSAAESMNEVADGSGETTR